METGEEKSTNTRIRWISKTSFVTFFPHGELEIPSQVPGLTALHSISFQDTTQDIWQGLSEQPLTSLNVWRFIFPGTRNRQIDIVAYHTTWFWADKRVLALLGTDLGIWHWCLFVVMVGVRSRSGEMWPEYCHAQSVSGPMSLSGTPADWEAANHNTAELTWEPIREETNGR